MTKTMFYQLTKMTYRICRKTIEHPNIEQHLSLILPSYFQARDDTMVSPHVLYGRRPMPHTFTQLYAPTILDGGKWPSLLESDLAAYLFNSISIQREIYHVLLDFISNKIPTIDQLDLLDGIHDVNDLTKLWSRLIWYTIILDHQSPEDQALILRKKVS